MLIKKDGWPPQWPDLNKMDYSVRDSLTKKVCGWRTEKFTEQELKFQLLKFVCKTIFSRKRDFDWLIPRM